MDGTSAVDNANAGEDRQLVTPDLTPDPEDAPIHENRVATTAPRSNGGLTLEIPSGPTVVQNGITTETISTGRSRSVSVPLKPLQIAPHDDSLTSKAPLTEAVSPTQQTTRKEVLKLSSSRIQELTSAPESLPVRLATPTGESGRRSTVALPSPRDTSQWNQGQINGSRGPDHTNGETVHNGFGSTVEEGDDVFWSSPTERERQRSLPFRKHDLAEESMNGSTRPVPWRSSSIPELHQQDATVVENHRVFRQRGKNAAGNVFNQIEPDSAPPEDTVDSKRSPILDSPPSPSPDDIPLPPFSLPTFLHLELASERPSPLYIHRPVRNDIPFEPSSVKFERLLNFFLLTPLLEQVFLFGALTCLDAWLYHFTILPLRFLRALGMLLQWAWTNTIKELRDLLNFVYNGIGRVWHRQRLKMDQNQRDMSDSTASSYPVRTDINGPMNGSAISTAVEGKEDDANPTSLRRPSTPVRSQRRESHRGHRRTRSIPSLLQPSHKADLLQGLLIIISCVILMRFDASRMYHGVRLQATIKLYVIYNGLEVCDRLFSALGQDIIECLLSPDTLHRNPNGRSKIIKPFWMFCLALIYTVIHATAFFYQVITLNVAVNSNNNALLTLLISNQFVEIKGTVFKKFEKESLFQLTCADVVERFQLWIMLLIIALRNIVELGAPSAAAGGFNGSSTGGSMTNMTADSTFGIFGLISNAFTVLPSIFRTQVMGPIVFILGSEMLVDWLKHAYITKFNATSPKVYNRFLDVLAKDYYSHAFAEQNLVRRLGLPAIPLACIFIRSMLQTYHKFLATNITAPVMSTATSLTESDATASPALVQIDHIFRNALGRSSFGGGSKTNVSGWWNWTLDDVIALVTMLVFFVAVYLILLAIKLTLGMILLGFARRRYVGMKKREQEPIIDTKSRRNGPYGSVAVGDERRRIIYDGDPQGLKMMRDKEAKARERELKEHGKGDRLDTVDRYRMVGKRIW